MAIGLNKFGFHIVLVLALAIAVSSCGRRGDLELPGSTQAESADSSILPQDTENEPDQPAEEKEDKPFFLDPLL